MQKRELTFGQRVEKIRQSRLARKAAGRRLAQLEQRIRQDETRRGH